MPVVIRAAKMTRGNLRPLKHNSVGLDLARTRSLTSRSKSKSPTDHAGKQRASSQNANWPNYVSFTKSLAVGSVSDIGQNSISVSVAVSTDEAGKGSIDDATPKSLNATIW